MGIIVVFYSFYSGIKISFVKRKFIFQKLIKLLEYFFSKISIVGCAINRQRAAPCIDLHIKRFANFIQIIVVRTEELSGKNRIFKRNVFHFLDLLIKITSFSLNSLADFFILAIICQKYQAIIKSPDLKPSREKNKTILINRFPIIYCKIILS